MLRYVDINTDFTSIHCRNYVSAGYVLSGVQHRNHCPYCLWSRHLDLYKAGDRLAACKAPMQPVGLTIKRRDKKYASMSSGELMLIHLCTDCGKVSINREGYEDGRPVFPRYPYLYTDRIEVCFLKFLPSKTPGKGARRPEPHRMRA